MPPYSCRSLMKPRHKIFIGDAQWFTVCEGEVPDRPKSAPPSSVRQSDLSDKLGLFFSFLTYIFLWHYNRY